jgi:hypothetical protein
VREEDLTMLHVSNVSGPLDTSMLSIDDEGVLENHRRRRVRVRLSKLDDKGLTADVASQPREIRSASRIEDGQGKRTNLAEPGRIREVVTPPEMERLKASSWVLRPSRERRKGRMGSLSESVS